MFTDFVIIGVTNYFQIIILQLIILLYEMFSSGTYYLRTSSNKNYFSVAFMGDVGRRIDSQMID